MCVQKCSSGSPRTAASAALHTLHYIYVGKWGFNAHLPSTANRSSSPRVVDRRKLNSSGVISSPPRTASERVSTDQLGGCCFPHAHLHTGHAQIRYYLLDLHKLLIVLICPDLIYVYTVYRFTWDMQLIPSTMGNIVFHISELYADCIPCICY